MRASDCLAVSECDRARDFVPQNCRKLLGQSKRISAGAFLRNSEGAIPCLRFNARIHAHLVPIRNAPRCGHAISRMSSPNSRADAIEAYLGIKTTT